MASLLKKAHDPFDSAKIKQTIAEQSKTRLRGGASKPVAGGSE